MRIQALFLPLGVFLFLTCAPLANPPFPAPRAAIAPQPPVLPISQGIDRQLRITVGVRPVVGGRVGGLIDRYKNAKAPALQRERPTADLAAWILEPRAGTPIRGTVLFFHGFGTDHRSVANAAEAIRRNGYRAVLLDMRGFGESTGVHEDFGPTDAADATEVIDFLQARKLCGATIGVYGTSLGAATSILLAGLDQRVSSVVAVAPFADIRTEVPYFARGVLGSVSDYLQDDELNRLANTVSKVTKWDLDNARPIDAIQKTKAQVLLIHGDRDEYIPHDASEQLHAAAADHSQLVSPHNRGHLDLCFDFPGELQNLTKQWFDKTLMPH